MKMNRIEKAIYYVETYQYGEFDRGRMVVPRHSFDLDNDTIDIVLVALNLMKTLAERDYPHNFQRERSDLVEHCYKMTTIQRNAKEICK